MNIVPNWESVWKCIGETLPNPETQGCPTLVAQFATGWGFLTSFPTVQKVKTPALCLQNRETQGTGHPQFPRSLACTSRNIIPKPTPVPSGGPYKPRPCPT